MTDRTDVDTLADRIAKELPNPSWAHAALSDLAARARDTEIEAGVAEDYDFDRLVLVTRVAELEGQLRDADAAFAWITANHPKVMRELPTSLYRRLRRAALAGDGGGT